MEDSQNEILGCQLFKQFISLQRGSIEQYYRAGASRMGLRVGEFTTLLQIYLSEVEGEAATVSALSALNHCTKSNISQITKILENKAYITREPSPTDHRTMYLTLTDEARALLNHNDFIGKKVFVTAVERFGTDKSRELLTLLEDYLDIYQACAHELARSSED